MLGAKRLHEHLAPARPTTGATGNLRQQLKRALAGPEVSPVQADVSIDHADHRHIGEIESLGDHLRAQENVDPAAVAKGVQHPAMAVPGQRIVSLSISRTTRPGNLVSISPCSFSVPIPLGSVTLRLEAALRALLGPAAVPRSRSNGTWPRCFPCGRLKPWSRNRHCSTCPQRGGNGCTWQTRVD